MTVPEKHNQTFEALRHTTAEGGEYWSARELFPALEYSRWEKFKELIVRAQTACETAGEKASDHFHLEVKMVRLGSGSSRKIEDYHLSRYACYLIVQNGDPSKPVIALGQTYFAIQTRRQELADDAAFKALSEEDRRLFLRNELREHNKALVETAKRAGVRTELDYAIFQNHGYKGLYGGMDAKAIHAHKGLRPISSAQPRLKKKFAAKISPGSRRQTRRTTKSDKKYEKQFRNLAEHCRRICRARRKEFRKLNGSVRRLHKMKASRSSLRNKMRGFSQK